MEAYNVADLHAACRKRLPRGVYEFLERGAEDDQALAANLAGFADLAIAPSIFLGAADIDPSTRLFGGGQAAPIAIAPTGGNGFFWPDGDLALARAACAASLPFTVSSPATIDIEVLAKTGAELWFQLYFRGDRDLSYYALERARGAGVRVLMVTADMAVPPNREFNMRNRFEMPFRLSPRNAMDIVRHLRWVSNVPLRYMMRGGMPTQANLPPGVSAAAAGVPSANLQFRGESIVWDDIAELRDHWDGDLLVKGVLRSEDAEKAVAIGCDGVVVSNHGGRALDAAVGTMSVLPEIARAVGDRATVLIDGGVRRGTDVAKAVALGADAVLVGRAPLYGLAAYGEEGAHRALHLLKAELIRTMAQAGCRDAAGLRSLKITPR